jgi:hypothetical protein
MKPPGYESCILVVRKNRFTYEFYNDCPVRLAINVCMTDVLGKTRLYQSKRTIPLGGRFTVFTLYPVTSGNMSLTASPYAATIPAACEKKPEPEEKTQK